MATMLETMKRDYLRARKAYYAGNPIRTDAQFDYLEEQIAKLDPNWKPKRKPVGVMTGQNVAFTGYRDAKQAEAIRAAGGVVQASMNAQTTILLYSETGKASGKLEKARAKGIRVTTFSHLRLI